MIKKVLFIVPSLGMGGMERVLVNYANLFVKRGYDVTVLNLTDDDEAIIKHFDEKVNYRPRYVPVKNILHSNFNDIIHGRIRFLKWERWIRFHSPQYLHKKYIKDKYDIEIAFFGISQMKIISGADCKRTQTMAWIHGLQLDSDIKPVGRLKDAVKVYNSIGKIVCVSKQAQEEVAQRFGRLENVFTVNNPNDTQKIRLLGDEKTDLPEKNRFTFITAARLDDKQKGFSRLLEVCKRLNDEGFLYDYHIIGTGIDEALIKEIAIKNKLDNVKFFGQQSNPYKYIKNADMYICGSYSEGFSMVMMEDIILATPMLTTDVSGADEMLENGKYGMIVENSSEGLYNGMKAVLSDSTLYDYYRAKAEERKDYLNENAIMDKLVTIINKQ